MNFISSEKEKMFWEEGYLSSLLPQETVIIYSAYQPFKAV